MLLMSSLTTSCKGVFCLRAISKAAVVQVSEQSTKNYCLLWKTGWNTFPTCFFLFNHGVVGHTVVVRVGNPDVVVCDDAFGVIDAVACCEGEFGRLIGLRRCLDGRVVLEGISADVLGRVAGVRA